MEKTTIYRRPMGENLFEEELTVEASTALTCLVYNIFRYEQLCRCQAAIVEKALASVQG